MLKEHVLQKEFMMHINDDFPIFKLKFLLYYTCIVKKIHKYIFNIC